MYGFVATERNAKFGRSKQTDLRQIASGLP